MHRIFESSVVPVLVMAAAARLVAATPPMVGDKAPDFALSTVQGKTVRLSEVAAKGPVVLASISTRNNSVTGMGVLGGEVTTQAN